MNNLFELAIEVKVTYKRGRTASDYVTNPNDMGSEEEEQARDNGGNTTKSSDAKASALSDMNATHWTQDIHSRKKILRGQCRDILFHSDTNFSEGKSLW